MAKHPPGSDDAKTTSQSEPTYEGRLLLLERLESIESRIAKLDNTRADTTAAGKNRDNESPWWRKGTFVVLLGGLATFGVPMATAIGGALAGVMESQRMMLTLEHEIVKEHLNAVLSQPIGGDAHVRRIQFLRKFRSDTTLERGLLKDLFTSGLTSKLGDWASNEYDTYFKFLDKEVTELHNKIIDAEIELAKRIRALSEAKKLQLEWQVDPDRNRGSSKELVSVQNRLDDLISDFQNALEEGKASVLGLRTRWGEIDLIYKADNRSPHLMLSDDFFDDLSASCSVKDVVFDESRCLALGEEAYERSIAPGSGDKTTYQKTSVEIFSALCTRNVAYACSMIGRSYRLGQSVTTDERGNMAVAADLYEKSCTLGDSNGCNGLGWRLYRGEGRARDPAKARALFEKACQQGNWNGCDSLGTFYVESAEAKSGLKDKERKENRVKAQRAFSDACSRKEVRGCINLLNLLAGATSNHFRRP